MSTRFKSLFVLQTHDQIEEIELQNKLIKYTKESLLTCRFGLIQQCDWKVLN